MANLYARQTVGLVDAVEPAAVIVARIVSEAQTRLPAAPRIACGADELAIDELTARFFTTFTNRNGVIPDFDRFDELFIPEATLIKNVGGMPVVYDVAGFLEPRKRSSPTVRYANSRSTKPRHKRTCTEISRATP